ncbi:MAG: GNAT family protein [Henriciella sp.]|nr:GNAT family protein [Henriciella sp.]
MSLRLRKFEKSNFAQLKNWFKSEEDVLLWAGESMPYPFESIDLRMLMKDHRGPRPVREIWAVCDALETVIGHVQITYNERTQQAVLGRIGLDPAVRGQKLALPMVKMAVDKAFERADINRVELRVYDHNAAASHVYEKAGFVLEGTRRKSTPIRGTYWNTNIMSILREEYAAFDKRT